MDDAVEAFEAAAAAFVACVRRGLGGQESGTASGAADPLREQADACLDGLAESARVDAMMAAFRVRLTAGFADKAAALDAPAKSPGEHTAQERAVVSEVACVLTVSERSASALLGQSHELTTALPLTLAALQAGSISWQHARIMVDETANLDPAGAASMEAHFLDPSAVNPVGELVPGRFRARARTWRERHHPVSIEIRHARSVLDRRLEYAPDRDGMAWLSAYLPADQAAGIWSGITAAARALQGPREGRTLTQLRVDSLATRLLGSGRPHTARTDTGHPDTARTETSRTHTAADSLSPAGAPAESDARGVNAKDVLAGLVPSPAAQVLVTVPVFALMGLTDEPAMLDGHGPIPASMARTLVAEGATSFHRVLVDPRDGAPLEIGRDSYRIPRRCADGCGCGTENAPSPAAATPPSTTKRTTSWPGPTAAPPALRTSANPAPNTTNSNTAPAGHPPQQAKTRRPAGCHLLVATTPANTRTGNHPTGHPKCWACDLTKY